MLTNKKLRGGVPASRREIGTQARCYKDGLASVRAPALAMKSFLHLIRFSHTLFALPWAIAGLFLGCGGWPPIPVLLWVLVAMVAARTAAMTFNRLADRAIDAWNPRTASRPSVTGEVSVGVMRGALLLAATLFVLAAFQLGPLCGWLSFPTLLVLLGYSLCKRFTRYSHYVLGLALGLSPVGAALAGAGSFNGDVGAASLMGLAVVFWTAGFDIFYAIADLQVDRQQGLHSVPASVGSRRALIWARLSHALVPVFLALAGVFGGLGLLYFLGVGLVAALLIYEHILVASRTEQRVQRAFFQVNVAIAVLMMMAVILDQVQGGTP